MGMKSTFFESAILICIPILVFATGLALSLDSSLDENHPSHHHWHETSICVTRLLLGLGVAMGTDTLLHYYPLWDPVYQ
jgi:hypothetical protein